MEKLHYTVVINAPKEKVWSTMLEDQSYREWTAAFNAGSYFKGDWSKGSKMLFLGPDPRDGVEGGMVAEVVENKPYEFISLHHYGLYKNGVEDTTSDEVKKWANAFENYTFTTVDSGTEVAVDLEGASELAEMFNDTWPKALAKLKEIVERS
ncbi:MAG: SRPBCC domain-containing protein [Patescibacteria group bacterium]|jgi:uncharacterized protein YndB with AHSA1/START domain